MSDDTTRMRPFESIARWQREYTVNTEAVVREDDTSRRISILSQEILKLQTENRNTIEMLEYLKDMMNEEFKKRS